MVPSYEADATASRSPESRESRPPHQTTPDAPGGPLAWGPQIMLANSFGCRNKVRTYAPTDGMAYGLNVRDLTWGKSAAIRGAGFARCLIHRAFRAAGLGDLAVRLLWGASAPQSNLRTLPKVNILITSWAHRPIDS